MKTIEETKVIVVEKVNNNLNLEYKKIIEHFLDSQKIPYALLINAEWGEGKTWYVLNKFHEDFHSKKIIYVSLNGETSTDSIAESIFYRKMELKSGVKTGGLNTKKRAGINLVKTLSKGVLFKILNLSDQDKGTIGDSWQTISANIDTYCSLNKDEILILDDLERCKIDVEELFGFIANNFTENNAGKVIIIANEREIKYENYSKLKEKVIWQTVEFQSEFNILEHITEYANTINKEKNIPKFIKELFDIYEITNKRTILFLLEKIEKFISEAQYVDKEDLEIFIHTLIVLGNEYRKGSIVNIKEDDIPQFITDPYYNINIFLQNSYSRVKDKNHTEDVSQNAFKDYFTNKYINNPKRHRFQFSYTMFILAVRGYFDEKLWVEEYEAYKEKKIKPTPPHIENLNKFITIHKASDKEFNEISKQLFNEIADSKFDLYYLVRAAYNVEGFDSMGIQFEKSNKDIFTLIYDQLSLSIPLTEYNFNGLRPFSENLESKSNEFKHIFERASDIQKELDKKQIKVILNSLFDVLINNETLIKDPNDFINLIENLTSEQFELIADFYLQSGDNREVIYQYIKNAFQYEEKFKSGQPFSINLDLIIFTIEGKLTINTPATAYGLKELKNIITQIQKV